MRVAIILTLVSYVASQTLKTKYGLLAGSWMTSTGGKKYAAFQGIPYARPPIGKYRFREPQPLKPWLGVWNATQPLSACLQYDPLDGQILGQENCLFVNVYTSNPDPAARLPVMVYIHGGAFMFGYSHFYDPSHLMDKDIVLVTLNYRLGALGFLSTGDEVVPGNNGLKDQSFALNWVKENIKTFGGDPKRITLSGNSAGGASVHYHYLSPMSKGTFHRGIAFSGSAFSSWTRAVNPADKARTLASMIGCPVTDSWEMADCLRYRPAEVILNAQIDMYKWRVHLFTPFRPTVEVNHKAAFLTEDPYKATISGKTMKVPLITSVTSEEGLYPAAEYLTDLTILDDLENQWETLASDIFEYNDTVPAHLRSSVAQKIKKEYLKDQPVNMKTFNQLVEALGDRLFNMDVGKLAEIHAKMSGQPVYMYKYSFPGEYSLSQLFTHDDKTYGASHADDVFHAFKFPGVESIPKGDKKMIENMLDLIYTYVNTGVPTFGNTKWNTVNPGSKNLDYLEITGPDTASMKKSSDFGRRAFWDNLGLKENDYVHLNCKDEL